MKREETQVFFKYLSNNMHFRSINTHNKELRARASSMYYALFLSVVIGLFLGALILFSGLNKQYASQLNMQESLIDNAYSGIEYGLTNHLELKPSEPVQINLFGKGVDSVAIERKNWGAFTVILSTASHNGMKYAKSALSGIEVKEDDPNLYLADQGRSFSICGKTRIEGKCYIPKAGVERAYIEGKNYQGKKMIYGSSSDSKRSLPEIDPQILSQLNDLKGEILPWETTDSVKRSFTEEGLHFINDGYLSLNNIYLSGQIIIEAKDSIFVSSSAQLDQVILKSPVVYIQSGFQGCAQIYATESITLEDDVVLKYPSVLGIHEEVFPKEEHAQITIGEGSRVIGSLFAITDKPNFRLLPQISIEKEAKLDGFLFCQGRTQLKGTVNGSLYTQKFYLETRSSKYENHLLDATITNDLPKEFVYIPLIKKNHQNHSEPLTQIAWLQ